MNGEQVLDLYETVSCLTERMLAAAQRSDWDNLIELEADYHGHVQVLKASEPLPGLSGESRARKVACLHRILAADREIRSITESWTVQLAALLGNVSAQRKLNAAYGPAR